MKKEGLARIWEIDFLRGLAIILMVGYHLLYDVGDFVGLSTFLGFSTDLSTPAWLVAQHFFAGLFVFLSGISSNLSRNNFRRSLKYLAVALIITLVTYLFDPPSTIYFGIIHCLGVSVIIYNLAFKKARPAFCLLAGILIIGLTFLLPSVNKALSLESNWLLPLGIHSLGFASYDYFPLIPWLGVFLTGVAAGRWLYTSKKSLLPRTPPENFINWCGRHSLLIYLLHQPIIIGILYLLGYITLF